MPRKARTAILYDGCFAHVFSRSIEKRFIFESSEHFDAFLNLLFEAKQRYGFQVFHYCILHTHFHLAVGMEKVESFSAAMKWLKWQYTQKYNRKWNRRGTVWQGRFQGLVIENERYLKACGLYIERNPVEAGLVTNAADWPHSSSQFYEQGAADRLIDSYEWDLILPKQERDEKEFFEKGMGIGSELFQLYLEDQIAGSITQ